MNFPSILRLGARAPLAALLLALVLSPAVAVGAPPLVTPAAPAAEYRLPESPDELLRVDDEMRAFFAPRVRRFAGLEYRTDDIVAAILGEEGLHFAYEGDGLYDVREAFRRRRGNCVTFAMLVVAVAREYRVPAKFNDVEMRPLWNRAGGLVLEARHINVRVDAGGPGFEIDLQLFANLRAVRRSAHVVSDARAFAGLYSNAGVYRMAAGDRAGAMELLERATRIDPTFASAWSNLGVAHLLAGAAEPARLCYARALAERPDSMAALSGMARIVRAAGESAEAERLERKVGRYRERNPYYLYALAKEEFASGRLEAARGHLARAVKIKGDEPLFLELLVAVSRSQGRDREAMKWAGRLERFRRDVVAMR